MNLIAKYVFWFLVVLSLTILVIACVNAGHPEVALEVVRTIGLVVGGAGAGAYALNKTTGGTS